MKILYDVLEKGAYSNLASGESHLPSSMEPRDRAFASAAVYGTLARIVSIDALLGRFSRIPVDRLQPYIRTILRLGLWQLFWSRSVPPSAACDTSTGLARRFANPGAVGYVNAVLRAASRSPSAATFPADDPKAALSDRAASLSLRHSLPVWMAFRLLSVYGDEADALSAAFQLAPKTTARANRLKTTPSALAERLAEEGVTTENGTFMPEALSIDLSGHPVARLASFREGWFMIQDEAAMLVAHIADPRPGESVLDVCAAPGGKTTHMAERMGNRGRIVARDSQEGRISLIRENSRRLGTTIVETQVRDATDPDRNGPGFDLVLVDVPCSGLGLLAKKPEIRIGMTEARAAALPELQDRILAAAAEENALRADAFLREQGGRFEPDPFEDRIPQALSTLDPETLAQARSGRLQLLPHRHGCDGFFIARFRRSTS